MKGSGDVVTDEAGYRKLQPGMCKRGGDSFIESKPKRTLRLRNARSSHRKKEDLAIRSGKYIDVL